MLLGALNSSGQYALSSGIINANLVAQETGRPGAEGAALRSPCNGQPAVCVCTKDPREESRRHRGQEGAQLVLSELFKVNKVSGANGTLLLVVRSTVGPGKELGLFNSPVTLKVQCAIYYYYYF